MTVSTETLKREMMAAALTGLLASGKVVEVDLLVDSNGVQTGHRMEHAALVTQMAATIANQAVIAFRTAKV